MPQRELIWGRIGCGGSGGGRGGPKGELPELRFSARLDRGDHSLLSFCR